MADASVLSPAELAECDRERPHVGGRILALESGQAVLADAFGQVNVRFRSTPELQIGDFVVVAGGIEEPGHLSDAELIERHPARPPRGDSDFARFSLAGVGKRLRMRSRGFEVIRETLTGLGFIEVDAPMLVRAPGLDSFVEAVPCGDEYLSTSPEFQLKRLLAGGVPRLYCLGHVARADETGHRHEREFCMLEWYRAFAGADAMRRDTEQVVSRVALSLTGAEWITLPAGSRIDLRPPFERMTVREAFRSWVGVADAAALAEADPARYFRLFVDVIEPALARLDRPVFLEQYPASQAALARLSPSDPSVAERFELFVAGVELCNAFVELTDEREQRKRFELELQRRRARGHADVPLDERFLDALSQGLPPCTGNALGVDRLLALCMGQSEIRDVMPFPQDWL